MYVTTFLLLHSFSFHIPHFMNSMATEYTSIFGSPSNPALLAVPSGNTVQTMTTPTTPSPFPTDPFRNVVIDPNGDLYLQVGEIKPEHAGSLTTSISKQFRVDSKALSRASPVFMKMLCGSFAEAKKPDGPDNQKWVVKLPDDNSSAMSILLHIMHCRFDGAPSVGGHTPLEDLYQIAILTDKYDCTAFVRPWVKHWLAMADVLTPNASIGELERISWIAWEYGDRNLFEKVVQRFILELNILNNNSLGSTPFSAPFFHDTLEPGGLIGMCRHGIVWIDSVGLIISCRLGTIPASGNN